MGIRQRKGDQSWNCWAPRGKRQLNLMMTNRNFSRNASSAEMTWWIHVTSTYSLQLIAHSQSLPSFLIGLLTVVQFWMYSVFFSLLRKYEALENEVNGSTSALLVQKWVFSFLISYDSLRVFSFSSIRQIVMCWLETYPEDFYDPDKDFAMLTSLLDFGGRNKLTELRAKARKQRERFKRIYDEGGMIAALPSLGQFVANMGFDPSDYPNNIKERVKMFDVGKENCVQIAEQLTFWDAVSCNDAFFGFDWTRLFLGAVQRTSDSSVSGMCVVKAENCWRESVHCESNHRTVQLGVAESHD